ncbi:urease accessory protein UreD [Pseudoduganella sp. RAF53_2]|uniref:urease accessory protein UreD n=1 Tax=Pseudoduganella sp. RAF53_2 TaxID=3233060 RepID=UPI003F94B268
MRDSTVQHDSNHSQHEAWHARLALGFTHAHGATRLTRREHHGPLRVQKPLYPEDQQVCHAIVVHPPGGVVGGDHLDIAVQAAAGTHAVLTTPGAAKWYRANGKVSRQQVSLHAAGRAAIEWLPQEAIFYDETIAELEHDVELNADASYIGCDIICLGRRASGERFRSGRVAQRCRIRRGGKLLWWEQGVITPEALRSRFGLRGQSVCATMLAVGASLSISALQEVRAIGGPHFGASLLRNLLVVRHIGDDSEAARALMLDAWRVLRPHVMQRAATPLRSWHT